MRIERTLSFQLSSLCFLTYSCLSCYEVYIENVTEFLLSAGRKTLMFKKRKEKSLIKGITFILKVFAHLKLPL